MNRALFFWQRRKNKSLRLARENIPAKLIRRAGVLCGILVIHSVIIYYAEAMRFVDALWLSLTSITTVGYGDYSATTWLGRTATIVLIYVCGIWLLAQFAGDFIDYRADKREKMVKGLWRWKQMSDHIVIINTPSTGGDRYLTRLITQIKQTPDLAALPVQIATHAYPEGLPDALRKMDVVHCHIDPGNSVQVNDLNIATASYIVILCQDENDLRSDSLTLDILDRINHQQNHAFIVAECIADDNRERFKRLQANAVIRPIRSYPELVVRALSAPGTECVLENLFTHGGSSTRRFDVRLHQIQWQAVACKLIQANIGTPLGFINDSGEVITNPDGNTVITGCALLIMVNDNHHTANSNVIDLLQ